MKKYFCLALCCCFLLFFVGCTQQNTNSTTGPVWEDGGSIPDKLQSVIESKFEKLNIAGYTTVEYYINSASKTTDTLLVFHFPQKEAIKINASLGLAIFMIGKQAN